MWKDMNKNKPNKYAVPPTKIHSIINSDFAQDFDPIMHYFNNLPTWSPNDNDYIEQFMNKVKVADEQSKIWRAFWSKWIIAVVAQALGRGTNHTCLVLSGAQGVGKTTFFNNLVPEELIEYYTTTQINPADKDSKIALAENFLINLDELESINRDEIGHLKSLLTIKDIVVRRPYARHAEQSIRRASFAGSINKAYFLTDLTGNRRFLIVDTISIEHSKPTEQELKGLYSQALYKLNQGTTYWFDLEDINAINEHNKKYQIIAPEEELINKYYTLPDSNLSEKEIDHFIRVGALNFITATEIANKLQKDTLIKLSFNKLAQILKNMGFEQKIKWVAGKVKRGYIVKDTKDYVDESTF
jgi:predicted P-loop ATPase